MLLAWLHPSQQDTWQVKFSLETLLPFVKRAPATPLHDPETRYLSMKSSDLVTKVAAVSPFMALGDAVIITPRRAMKAFLTRHTSTEAVDALRPQAAVIRLYDDYIHDSRAWFRVPHFREYVPGGFFWGQRHAG